MKTLTIRDLARSEHLDRPTMAAVRGGWKIRAQLPAPGVHERRYDEIGKAKKFVYTGENGSGLSLTSTEKQHGYD